MEKEKPSDENPESLESHSTLKLDEELAAVHQITRLELEIEQQKLLRLKDAKQVEEKAAKIKEWVTCKLKELEQQNLHLREQNLKCNQQLQILKTHLENTSSSCCSSKSSVDCSLHATTAPPEDLHPANPHFWSMTSTFPQYQLRKNMGMNPQDLKRDLISAIDSLNLDGCSTSPKTIKCSTDSDTDPAHDYAEIYTPCRENYNDWILKGSGDDSSQSVFKPPQPPTPPLHRFPSWEAKIYEVANDGLIRSDNGETSLSGSIQMHDASTEDFGKINIPVYATVKGRASQIRSMPFSGDSSDDSSDGEMHNSDSTLDHGTFNKSEKSCSPSKSFKTASNADVRTFDSPRNPRRELSIASGISEDYAVPPDAVTEVSPKTVLDSSLMSISYTNSPNKKTDLLEKSGQLSTLGGKLKTWRKRWFVLKNGTLSYWKNQSDISNRSPQGTIILNEDCVINRPDSSSTFEILTKQKNYYLTAETYSDMDEWVRVLQNVQKLYTTQLLLNTENQKPSIEGWVTKVKNGHAKKCWCILMGKTLLYFKTSQDKNPLGQLNMRETKVEGVEHTSDSESDAEEKSDDLSESSSSKQTIAIYPMNQDPIYLIFSEKHEFDNWLYHLIVVSGGSGSNEGTEYERLVQKLMESDGDPNSDLWYNPVLLYSKNAITTPLSTLTTDHSQSEAIKLFKSCQLFMSVAVSVPAIDYHIVLAQNALQVGLDMPELQTELFCCLIKQTTKYTGQISKKLSKQKRSQHSSSSECKHNPPAYSLLQGWQLLSLACSLFVPKNKMLWYLKMHLSRNVDVNTDTGKYAAYCERALQRTLDNGGRTSKPSRMEILSIIMKNPYHHSLPHAIPVHMANGSYHVISFDGSSTIQEFQSTLSQEIGTRDSSNGFCLFSDDPIEKDLEHYLEPRCKLCDVISKWETVLREKGSGKFENTRVIRITYQNRLYWKSSIKYETEKEKLLLCYQINNQIVQGRFPLSKDLAIELASLMAQIDMGDYSPEKCKMSTTTSSGSMSNTPSVQALDKFYPYRYRDSLNTEGIKEIQEILVKKWLLLKGRSTADCERIYLTCCRKWKFFGATLFQAKPKFSDQAMIWLAVSEDSISVLELSTMIPLVTYNFSSIITFGGCQEDFMLVVGVPGDSCEKQLLFAMSKPKILEITLLLADYMNALGHTIPRKTINMKNRLTSTAPASSSATLLSTHNNQSYSGFGNPEPDILKSTPDHQILQ